MVRSATTRRRGAASGIFLPAAEGGRTRCSWKGSSAPTRSRRSGWTARRGSREISRHRAQPEYTFNETVFLQKTASIRQVQKAYDIADEGDKRLKEKRYAEALDKYREAISRQPEQAPLHTSAGRAYLIRKNYPGAESSLRRSIQLDNEYFEPHYLMGVSRYQQKDYRGAIPELSRSMDLLPTKQAAAYLSKSYEAIGDLQNAKKYSAMAK